MTDILKLGAREQARRIAQGELSAEALMRAMLDRISEVNGTLNAIVSLRDEAELMAEARDADAVRSRGPLHGLPIAVKDLDNVQGLPTSQGSPLFAGQIAEADDPYVARMRAAGVIFIGKTNAPEFGLGSHTYNPVHGATLNPYDQTRTCGGSSGGAAVALAAGMLSIADGSDMMGSLRNPAGWNNVYGLRPSWGRVPGTVQGDTFFHQITTHGPMARNPSDLALLLDAMSGADPRLPYGSGFAPVGIPEGDTSGCRIGWLDNWGGAVPFEEGILPLCEAALSVFETLGCSVEPVSPPFDRDALWHSWTTLRSWNIAAGLNDLYADPATRERLKPEAVWEIERGHEFSTMDVHQASAIRSGWYATAASLFDKFDALVLPTAQVWPFPVDWNWPREVAGVEMDSYHRWMEVMIPASLIGVPALAMPAGFGEAGLSMGIQLIGRHGNDAGLLELAEAYHQATEWPDSRPIQS